jgi:Na+/proline symporter
MWAVTLTDFFQLLLIVIGLLVIFPIVWKDIGGWTGVQSKVPSEFFYFYPRSNSTLVWLNYVQAWMLVGLGSLPAQDLIQRIMSSKSATVARWGSILAGCFYIILGLIPVIIGIFGRFVLPACADAQNLGKIVKDQSMLIEIAKYYLSAPIMALFVSALLAAIMSSADAALLAPATIIGHNLVPFFKPDASDALKLKWCKWSVPVIGLLALGMALYFQNIYTLCTEAWGVLLAGVVAPMIGGIYWKRANSISAAASAISGIACWFLCRWRLSEDYPSNMFGFFVSCLVLVIVSLVTPPPKPTNP